MYIPTKLKKTFRILSCAVGFAAISSSASAGEVQDVKFGFAGPLTGMSASFGKDLQDGVQLALNDANAQKILIGGKPVKFSIVAQDDQADPRVGVQVAQKLLDSNVAVVIGHFNSGTTIPASAIYQQAGMVMINPGATNPIINQRGFDHIFSVLGTDDDNAGRAAKYAVRVSKAKRIAILDDRTAFGQGEADHFDKVVKAEGGSIVDRQYCDDKTVDFSAQLTALKGANIDLLFFGGLDRQAAGVAKRMKQLGMTAQLVGGGAVADSDFLKLAGPAGEGVMAWEPGSPLENLPTGKEFGARFQRTFGLPAQSYAPFGYDATWAAIKAMQKADSVDPKVYLTAVKDISFTGVTGPIAFESNGALKGGSSTLYQVKQGKWVAIVTQTGK
ncbi:extracellular ligand-binding receptor [Caballeronia udeis]|uniref:Extracellular ligand-binding receptor n=1 Tax=Caballeronia udeis TaxID=1232866 RepID=A0A158H0X2_9BURK|nr:branched-chain amino acid ABC transporter substrate-binding protein [Caballeronia udeis]SAL37509.1 extracellular ligand-binding receptor [Caballeronia udeis]